METTKQADTSPRLASIEETGHALGGLGRSSVVKLLDKNELESVHLGRRRMVLVSSIDKLLGRATRR